MLKPRTFAVLGSIAGVAGFAIGAGAIALSPTPVIIGFNLILLTINAAVLAVNLILLRRMRRPLVGVTRAAETNLPGAPYAIPRLPPREVEGVRAKSPLNGGAIER